MATRSFDGRIDTTQLSAEEEEAWLDAFSEKMGFSQLLFYFL